MASIHSLYSNLLAYVARMLSLKDIVSLGSTCKRLNQSINGNSAIWMELSIRLLGHQAPDTRLQLNTKIGLTGDVLTWREFFQRTHGSSVLTWGTGGGRTGHGTQGYVSKPKVLSALSGKAVDFVGKTAEVGSVALSYGGSRAFFWGSLARSLVPIEVPQVEISGDPHDRIVDASCGHDSGFELVFESGRMFLAVTRWDHHSVERPRYFAHFCEASKDLFGHLLMPGEKPIKSLGSQAGVGGCLTNFGRVVGWGTYDAADYLSRMLIPPEVEENEAQEPAFEDDVDALMYRVDGHVQPPPYMPQRPTEPFDGIFVISPEDGETKEPLKIVDVAFGHKVWLCRTDTGALYWVVLNSDRYWVRVPGTEKLTDPIICCDAGSEHQAFCTLGGDAYTWGSTGFGMLGHGPEHQDRYSTIDMPKRVEFFRDLGKRVMAVGAGGYISWHGAFTLFLLEDNTLWRSGFLGDPNDVAPFPVKIECNALRGRHILSISCGEDWAAIVGSAQCLPPGEVLPEEPEESEGALGKRLFEEDEDLGFNLFG